MASCDKRKKTPYPKRSQKLSDHAKIIDACKQDECNNFTKTFIDGNIGFGVFTRKSFEANEILLEYKGDIISRKEALVRHAKYSQKGMGCFIYDVDIKSDKMSIDATHSSGFGKYVNDAHEKFANCRPKTFILNNVLHLFFFAKVFLPVGIELRYDYGDSKNQEWRQLKNYARPFTLDEIRESLYVGKTLQKKVVVTASEILSTFADKGSCKKKSVEENNLLNISSNLSTYIDVNVVSHPPSKIKIPQLVARKDIGENMKSYANLPETTAIVSNVDIFVSANNATDDIDLTNRCMKNVVTKNFVLNVTDSLPSSSHDIHFMDKCLENLPAEANNLKDSLIEVVTSSPSISVDTGCKRKRTFFHSKKKCPVCGYLFLKLPFHLREVHFWSNESSLAAVNQFRLRKKTVLKEHTKNKSSHYTKICPIDGCYSVTKNIGEHLKGKKHNLKPSVEYYALLKQACHFDASVLPLKTTVSPKKNYGVIKKDSKKKVLYYQSLDSMSTGPSTNVNFDE
ncbi:uncharacterized protein LOC136074851 [Hydra vulgaris]|uniref:Uncharacterized protein LOC136074851 n=1 Tax=Hydra vulgaris TaxID=6087 RepID=A0ABM4B2Y4_HYDVU